MRPLAPRLCPSVPRRDLLFGLRASPILAIVAREWDHNSLDRERTEGGQRIDRVEVERTCEGGARPRGVQDKGGTAGEDERLDAEVGCRTTRGDGLDAVAPVGEGRGASGGEFGREGGRVGGGTRCVFVGDDQDGDHCCWWGESCSWGYGNERREVTKRARGMEEDKDDFGARAPSLSILGDS